MFPFETIGPILNDSISAVVLLGGLILVMSAALTGRPQFISRTRHPATSLAFFCWLGWWASLVLAQLLRGEWYPIRLAVRALGDSALLGFSLFYLAGDHNHRIAWRVLIRWLLVSPLALPILLYGGSQAVHTTGTLSSAAALAPYIFLAQLAILLYGWASVVRWGVMAAPIFITAVVYAVLQLPANMWIHLGENRAQTLPTLLFLLGAGKIIFAGYSYALFLSTTDSQPDMRTARAWPQYAFVSYGAYTRVVRWVAVAVAAAVLTGLVRYWLDF